MRRIRREQKVKLEVRVDKNSDFGVDCIVYSCDDDRLVVDFPTSELNYRSIFAEGVELKVSVFTHSGILVFDAIVMDRLDVHNRLLLGVSREYECIQRRMFVRAGFEGVITVENELGEQFLGTTRDIGGGGIRFLTNDEMEHNSRVKFFIPLSLEEPGITGEGKLMKNEFLSENEYVIIFDKINEYSRSKLIKKCHEQEANDLKGVVL